MISISAIFERVRDRELDRKFLPTELLDVQARVRTNVLPWRGQFTPGLPELLIDAYDSRTGLISDPFVGSGTTLLEALRRGRASIGVEVNPAAYLLARILELASTSKGERYTLLRAGRCSLTRTYFEGSGGGLFGSINEDENSDTAAQLVALGSEASPRLSSLFNCVLLLSMGDKKGTSPSKVLKSWSAVDALVRTMPTDSVECRVVLSDARQKTAPPDSVGLTLTSPPYINVFNYHQNYRPAVELLGWRVLPAARSEIGSNRKHRSNRFLTVIQYAQDMLCALSEIVRVSKHGANLVLVVGRESRVRGVPFANGEILSALAEMLRTLKFLRWQERKFINRFGVVIYEEVLAFEVDKTSVVRAIEDFSAAGREVGVFCLDEAAGKTSVEVAGEIKAAIASAGCVDLSPFGEE